MEEGCQDYDDNALKSLLYIYRSKIQDLESRIMQLGEFFAPASILNERNELLKHLQLLHQIQMQRLPSSRTLPKRQAQALQAHVLHSSPFVPNRPLRANEPLFGRDDLLHAVSTTLVDACSVNLIGERGYGKTSFIHHVLDDIACFDTTQRLLRPLAVLVNLRDSIVDAQQFYGLALKRMVHMLNGKVIAQLQEYFPEVLQWSSQKQMSYDQFQYALHALRSDACYVMPIIILDDFEGLFQDTCDEDLRLLEFFNDLRVLLGEALLSMLIVSRKALGDYFLDPRYPGRLSSSFPRYCLPFVLEPLTNSAIEQLLLQASPQPLQLHDVEYAKTWAGSHPALLQCAGQALYEMYSQGNDYVWASNRFQVLQKNLPYWFR